ncbi:MAG: PulJ/GspJ family protein [Prochlorococcaceae cyanobacterium]
MLRDCLVARGSCGSAGLIGPARNPAAAGFSLVELLLAFGLGVSLCGLMLQAVLAEGRNSQRLGRVLRERLVAARALDLLRSDLQRAEAVASTAGPGNAFAACSLSGRAVVLHIETAEGPITYSLGKPAEPIWRGQVLMRCGPAFGLDGSPSAGQALNRVVLDGLAPHGVRALQQGAGALQVQLRQELPIGTRSPQVLLHERLLPLPSSFESS